MAPSSEKVSELMSEMDSWRIRETTTVTFQDLDWVLLPEVYPIERSHSSVFAWQVLQELEPVDSFLEIGCGPGNNVVLAVKAGLCRRATGADINPNSVESAQLNADRHGVADSVKLLVSDVFDALGEEDKFDLIFWNSMPDLDVESTELSVFERNFFDPGYEAHRRYFSQARRHLTETGRLMLLFCSNGSIDLLKRTAAEAGFTSEIIAERGEGHAHWLIEFRDAH
ncbi:SAM-dependent methyltransferase [Streptomyces sp. NPDC056580]|uniref:SAM-dependent methyltransferase n=1 Tax=Streptomyces sp. NPDC056580 TaxID=3345872 RepID=UPI0036901421